MAKIKPKDKETHKEFMSRCLNDDGMNKEHEDHKGRFKACTLIWNNDKKSLPSEKIVKIFPFKITETIEQKSKGSNIGIIKGYASTFGNIDRGGDIILANAFNDTIANFKESGRPIRMQFQHSTMDVIGGFPANKIKIDDNGLFVEGHINLDVQRGKEAYALAKQGVLTDFSIGFSINVADFTDAGVRVLKELTLWEVSMVSEPMNEQAQILDVKGATGFKDLPIADKDVPWDSAKAVIRVRKEVGAEDDPNKKYQSAFMWFDNESSDNFTSYKLPYVDVVDGKLKVIPRAIFAIASLLNGGRGGISLPAADRKKVISHVNKYYSKMGLDSPLKKDNTNCFETMKDIENFLKMPIGLSANERKILISKIKEFSSCRDDNDDKEELNNDNRDDLSGFEQKLDKVLLNQKMNEKIDKIINQLRGIK